MMVHKHVGLPPLAGIPRFHANFIKEIYCCPRFIATVTP